MDDIPKGVYIAIAVIAAAVIAIWGFNVLSSGKGLFNKGNEMLLENTAELLETNLTQYDGATIDGARVISLVKEYWVPDNYVAICICTKDGKNIMYDRDGATYAIVNDLIGLPVADAAGAALTNARSQILQASVSSHTGVETYNDNSGYSGTSLSVAGYVNTNAVFKGSIQRDGNENIRCITFVQK